MLSIRYASVPDAYAQGTLKGVTHRLYMTVPTCLENSVVEPELEP
jgi:hypothetical protein